MGDIFTTIQEQPKRVFCIGDIHGCPEEVSLLLDYFVQSEKLSSTDDMVIFLGDYIDRGPSSKEVVDLLLNFKKDHPLTRFLRGNHEDMMLSYFGFGGSMGHMYLFNGGVQFFRSYQLSSVDPADQNVRLIPEDHLEFYKSLEIGLILGNYIIVHAGLDPSLSLKEQTSRELLWIREEFIEETHSFDKTIVFGHTVYPEIYFDLPFKIGIDTGLVYGNRLTAVELKSRRYFEVERGSTFVLESPFPV
jgi:serine/threonine protein phosphatase 1